MQLEVVLNGFSSKMAIQSEVVDDSTDPPSPVMQFKILKKKPTECKHTIISVTHLTIIFFLL